MLFTPAKRNFGFDLFDNFFNDPAFFAPFERQTTSMMKTDIRDDGNGYALDIELPGYKKEDIQAELKDGYLTICANREEANEEKDDIGKFLRKERFTGSCKRSFYVGEAMKQENIKAGFENGILKIQFPKEAPKALEENRQYIPIEG